MDVILAVITSILIFLTFRVLEGKFPSFSFTILNLIRSRFEWKYVSLSIIVPFIGSLLFGIIHKTFIPAAYTIPGFLASLLIIWPFFRNPEGIPSEMQMEKQRTYIIYLFFIASFTLVSYIGGFIGNNGLTSLLSLSQGIRDGLWIVILGAFITHFAHRFLNKHTIVVKPTPKTDLKLPRENNQPLKT